jgi:hypothetical protein
VAADEEKLRVEPLGSNHDRSRFESGVEPLDRYFRSQASQDARKNMAAPFVLVLPDGTIAGYYTLSSTSVQLGEMPEQTVRNCRDIRWCRRHSWAGSRWTGVSKERVTAVSCWPMLAIVRSAVRSPHSR